MDFLIEEASNFVAVLVVAVAVAGAVSALYANGIRLWARGEEAYSATGSKHLSMRIAASACFALCVAIVLFALWLMIPVFH